jgi:hypothetical protein
MLTSAMVDAGAELTRKLDQIGVPITAALWLFEAELNEWRLVFASPEVTTLGSRDVYDKVRQAIDQLQERAAPVPLSLVTLMDANADLILRLRKALGTGSGISRIRFSKNVIDGHFIDDALIYRVV